ncbi:MAG: hypothetical protein HY567_00085 [Candidatus Kerfeldbacteria bacterium]|nr:hypothetical protein [Candidatus Kerfeldbacteria bacterium]
MVQRDMLKRMIELATSALGLVAALAWNSAIIELFKRIFGDVSGIISLFGYAVVVTVIAVLVVNKLQRMERRLAEKEKQTGPPQS